MSRGQPQYLEPVKEEMMQKAKSIIIAGGGIGGLSAAVGLSKHGFKVTVLERAPVLGEIGAGLQLGPNAFHAFDYLGIGDEARRMAVYVDKLRLIDATTAEDVAEIDLGEAFRKRFRNPYAVAHRGDLHGVYVRACRSNPSIDLRTGCNVIGYEQDGSSVRAILETGESVEGGDPDRRGRSLVEHPKQSGGRRRAASHGTYHLP
ncbi:FAD-dependent monooxygenase [Ensifer adhaerens]